MTSCRENALQCFDRLDITFSEDAVMFDKNSGKNKVKLDMYKHRFRNLLESQINNSN